MQKFDSCSGENYSGGGQTHPGAAEQTVIAQRQHHQQFLGPSESFRPHVSRHFILKIPQLRAVCFPAADASRALPDFMELELGPSNTENISPEDVKALQSLYREHCEVRDGVQGLTEEDQMDALRQEDSISTTETESGRKWRRRESVFNCILS